MTQKTSVILYCTLSSPANQSSYLFQRLPNTVFSICGTVACLASTNKSTGYFDLNKTGWYKPVLYAQNSGVE